MGKRKTDGDTATIAVRVSKELRDTIRELAGGKKNTRYWVLGVLEEAAKDGVHVNVKIEVE